MVYVNNYIVLYGAKGAIDSILSDENNFSVFTSHKILRESDNYLVVFGESVCDARYAYCGAEKWVKDMKRKYKLSFAFINAMEWDGFGIAYYKEIDGNVYDFANQFDALREKYADDDELLDAQNELERKIVGGYEAFIKTFI